MPAYIIATVRIEDPDRFAAYGKAIAGLSERHGGERIVGGPVADILEGDGVAGERVVMTRFPSEANARGYIRSAQYQDAKVLREGAASVVMRLLVD